MVDARLLARERGRDYENQQLLRDEPDDSPLVQQWERQRVHLSHFPTNR